MSGRCSPTEALAILRPAFEPMDAAAELTRAMHDNRCPLYCNGVGIPSHNIAPRLMVVAQPEKDGRWTARIVGTFAVGGVKPTVAMGGEEPEDVWEFEIEKVKALLPQPEPELEKPWPTVSGSVNWTPPAILAPATPQPESTPEPEPKPDNIRRKPGPKPEYPLWKLEAANFTHRFFKKNKRMPSAGEVAQHLQIKCDGWEPDDSDIRKLLRDLLPG
jgi:hypothetical protein